MILNEIPNDEAVIVVDNNGSFVKALNGPHVKRVWNNVLKGEKARPIWFWTHSSTSVGSVPQDLMDRKTGRISLRRHTCIPRPFEATTSDGQSYTVTARVNFSLDKERLQDAYHTQDFGTDFAFRIIDSFRAHFAQYASKSVMTHHLAIRAQVGIDLCKAEGIEGAEFHETLSEERTRESEETAARLEELTTKLDTLKEDQEPDKDARARIERLQREVDNLTLTKERLVRIAKAAQKRAMDARDAQKAADDRAQQAFKQQQAAKSDDEKEKEGKTKKVKRRADPLVITNALGIHVHSVSFEAKRQYSGQIGAAGEGSARINKTAAELGPLVYDEIADAFREEDETQPLDDDIVQATLDVLRLHTQQRTAEALAAKDGLMIVTGEELGATGQSATRDLIREIIREFQKDK